MIIFLENPSKSTKKTIVGNNKSSAKRPKTNSTGINSFATHENNQLENGI